MLPASPNTLSRKRLLGIATGLLVVLVALGGFWHLSPVASALEPSRVARWAEALARNPWAPLAVLTAYTPASLVLFPRGLITLFSAVAFGPWLGFAYAMAGILTAAALTFLFGRRTDRERVRAMAGATLDRLSEVLRGRGVLAMTAVRLVPIAPFAVVNAVAGAIRIRWFDFLAGTFLGMLPGTIAMVVFGDQLEAGLRDPREMNLSLLATAIVGVVIATIAVRRWLANDAGRSPTGD